MSFSDKYIIEKELGSGAYGEVLLVRDSQGNVRVAKIFKNGSKEDIEREFGVVADLDNAYVPKYYELYTNETYNNRKVYIIVMEYVRGMDMSKIIEYTIVFDNSTMLKFAKRIFSILAYIHSHDIVHRDIKLENIIFSDDHPIYLIDYGFACYTGSKAFKQKYLCEKKTKGSLMYVSPEILDNKFKDDLELLKKADIWAFGVSLYVIRYFSYPYDATDINDLKSSIKFTDVSYEYDDLLDTIIQSCLTKDARERPSAQEIISMIG
jgi:serine/threonine protein kinase